MKQVFFSAKRRKIPLQVRIANQSQFDFVQSFSTASFNHRFWKRINDYQISRHTTMSLWLAFSVPKITKKKATDNVKLEKRIGQILNKLKIDGERLKIDRSLLCTRQNY